MKKKVAPLHIQIGAVIIVSLIFLIPALVYFMVSKYLIAIHSQYVAFAYIIPTVVYVLLYLVAVKEWLFSSKKGGQNGK